MFYVNLVITRKKSLKDTQNVKTNKSEDIITKKVKSQRKTAREEGRKKELQSSQKTTNRMAIANPVCLWARSVVSDSLQPQGL